MSCLGGLLRKKRAYVFWCVRLDNQRGVAQTVLALLIIQHRVWDGHVGCFHNDTPRLLTPKRSSNYMSLKHMKSLIVLVVGLLAVGCLTPEQKQKALRVSVAGEYERKWKDRTDKLVLLDNGVREWYINGRKENEAKWSIANGELHVKYDSELINVHRINEDKSITNIAVIRDGKRIDTRKVKQETFKKIK